MGMLAVTAWIPDQLPRVRGRGWWLFLPVWMAICAAAAIGMAVPFAEDWRREGTIVSASGSAGIGLKSDAQGRPLVMYPQTGEAARAGIVPGLRLVAIDGVAVATVDGAQQRLAGQKGTITRLETIAPNGRRALHRLTRDPGHLREAYDASGLRRSILFAASVLGFYIGGCLLPLACGALLLVRRPGDRFAPWASLALLSCGLGLGPPAAWYSNYDPNSAVIAVLGGSATALLLLTLMLFPNGRFASRHTKILTVVTVVVTSIGSTLANFVVGNLILATGLTISLLVIARRMKRHADQQQVQQIRWFLAGFGGAAFALVLYTAAVTWRNNTASFGMWVWSDLVGWLLSFVVMGLLFGGITIGLLRYRLYDAEATISRSVAYGAVTIFLLGIFAGSEKIIELLGEQYFGQSMGRLAGVLGAASAAICIGPIHHRVTHWTEKRFRGGLVQLRDGLPLLADDMREIASPAALADAMLVRVERGVRAVHGAVVAGDRMIATRDMDADAVHAWLAASRHVLASANRLHAERTDPVFPMRVLLRAEGVGTVGWLLLGPRPDGSFYGKDERETLAAIADPVARALFIAMARERRAVERQEREVVIERKLEALTRFVQSRFGVDLASPAPPRVVDPRAADGPASPTAPVAQ